METTESKQDVHPWATQKGIQMGIERDRYKNVDRQPIDRLLLSTKTTIVHARPVQENACVNSVALDSQLEVPRPLTPVSL